MVVDSFVFRRWLAVFTIELTSYREERIYTQCITTIQNTNLPIQRHNEGRFAGLNE
jgi:hypothetical protein